MLLFICYIKGVPIFFSILTVSSQTALISDSLFSIYKCSFEF